MRTRILIFSILVLGVLTACTPNIYIPNATNIPLPNNKNELKVGGGYSEAGYYFEGSYALDSHIVIMADGAGQYTPDTNGAFSQNIFGEIGGGYYSHIGKYGRFEFIGAYGMGNVAANQFLIPFYLGGSKSLRRYIVNNNYNRITLQGDIAFSSKYAELGLSAKLSYLNMPGVYYHKQDLDTKSYAVLDDSSLNISQNEFFFEPCYFINLGIKNVKIHLCVGWSFLIGPDVHFWDLHQLYAGGFAATGITVDLFRKDLKNSK